MTKELFDARFDGALSKYPILHGAVPEIRDAMRGDAVSLEDYLRTTYRDGMDELDTQVRFTIPLYLQELLFRVSTEWLVRADWYALLVRQALRRFQRVVFVTLNYDILLDRELHAISPLDGIASFVAMSPARRWALVKLHGSITWKRRVLSEVYRPDRISPLFEVAGNIQHSWTEALSDMRTWNEPGYTGPGYPALSTPYGSEDELNCPNEHVEFLRSHMASEREIEMLVIGYSGYDEALIRILKEAEIMFGHIAVVDQDRDAASAALGRLSEGIRVRSSEVSSDRFEIFADNGGLTGHLQRRSEAYL